MGKFIWHQWGRLLAITSGTYMLWASLWALVYRKFFWDFIDGDLGPAGIIPGSNSLPFVAIIVHLPILQTITLFLSIFTLSLELPLPFVVGTGIHRSLILRVVVYFLTSLIGIMVYQTVDCSIYFVITSIVYAKALLAGEQVQSDEGQEEVEV